MRHIHRLKLRNSHQYRDGWDHLNEHTPIGDAEVVDTLTGEEQGTDPCAAPRLVQGNLGYGPSTCEDISDDEYNELEKDFNLGTVSVFQLHGFEQEELHRATGRALDIDEE